MTTTSRSALEPGYGDRSVPVDSSSRVLVTGASGLIGAHVVVALRAAGYRPRAFCRGDPPPEAGPVEQMRGDVRDHEAVRCAVRGCDAIIHTAAVYSYARADLEPMLATNVAGTRNVLDAAASEGVARVVLTSSAATCGPVARRPADEHDEPPPWEMAVPYKRTKLMAEQLSLERARWGQDIVVVNPTTTVGPLDRRPTPSGRMVRDVLEGRIRAYIASGGLNVVAAEDVARGHVLALERGRAGERYLLGGENLPMADLFALIASLAGVPPPRLAVPYPLALLAATLANAATRRMAREPSLIVLDEVKLARLPMYFSSAKARSELGFEARSAHDALRPAVAWFAAAARSSRPRRQLSVHVGLRPLRRV